jgi:periplasmic divalent cation tolerance protein
MADENVIVLTTWPADADAEAFARTIVEERLAACVNLSAPLTSLYRWQGTIEQAAERQITIKTTRARVEALKVRLHELHSYEVPELIVLPIAAGSEAYLTWISDSTAAAPEAPEKKRSGRAGAAKPKPQRR